MSSALYHEAIKALARAAHGAGRLDAPDGAVLLDNPLCGDRVAMQVTLRDGRIAALAHEVKGCLLCCAAASVIGRRAPGATVPEMEAVAAAVEGMLARAGGVPAGWEELAAFEPVRRARSRHRCVLLPFEALLTALDKAGRKP